VTETRKLAAIRVAGVVGYSRLGDADEGSHLTVSKPSQRADRPTIARPSPLTGPIDVAT